MKSFDIPVFYRSGIITKIKQARKVTDPRKKDFSPTVLDFGPVRYIIARHFGFCYGVENAIEISYRALEENPGKRIFLLSEMIHNPDVNNDLKERGIQFLMDTNGINLIDFDDLTPNDIVIIPAFGTTLEIEKELVSRNIAVKEYNTTCPFVEKVWNRSAKLGKDGFAIVIHGKAYHEETKATYSHSKDSAPSLIIKNMKEAIELGKYISGELPIEDFYLQFEGKFSKGFIAEEHLFKLGVVNQTTMLATETQAIANHLKQKLIDKFGTEKYREHFADTRDTLCYATNDNQSATYGLLKGGADLAIVVGGYKSSNTSHIVELCEEKMPTYFIQNADKLLSRDIISHYDLHTRQVTSTENYLLDKQPLDIILTSGASCPDAVVEAVMMKILSYYTNVKSVESVLAGFDIAAE